MKVFITLCVAKVVVLGVHIRETMQISTQLINMMVWQYTLKRIHSGLLTVQTALHLSFGIFNAEGRTPLDVLDELDVVQGDYCESFFK